MASRALTYSSSAGIGNKRMARRLMTLLGPPPQTSAYEYPVPLVLYPLHTVTTVDMASKTVALDNEAYELLRRQKRSEESFSDTVKRLARPRRPITTFAGMWKDVSDEERLALDRAYAALYDADARREAKIARLWRAK